MRVLCLLTLAVAAAAAPAALADDPASRARAALALQSALKKNDAIKAAKAAVIEWEPSYAAATRKAKAKSLPLLCVVVPDDAEARDALLTGPLADPAVVALSKKFVCVKLSPTEDKDLVRDLGASGPSVYVASPAGKVIDSKAGEKLKADQVVAVLKKASG